VSEFGTIALDPASRILGFREKSSDGEGMVNGGTYVLEPELIARIPRGRAVSLELDVFPTVLTGGYHLYGHQAEGQLVDIGTPAGYQHFCRMARSTHDHTQ
jgi:NDP-sugar pyrophosphorylase family protein